MAQISDLQTRFCVVWETKLGSPAESPSFSFQNFRWNFKLNLKSAAPGCQYGSRAAFYGSRYQDVDKNYTLTLLVLPNVPPSVRQFRVTILLERKGGNETPHVCNVGTFKNSNQLQWDFQDSTVFPEIPRSSTSERLIKFVCLLECDLPCPVVLHHPSKVTRSPGSFDLPPNLESLSLDLSKLLKDEVLPDVKLKSAERIFSAHRAVLAARSEVFAAMFRNKMVESETGVVNIDDVDARVLELFLRYVYTGQIRGLSEDLVPGLYAAGDKYTVRGLKKSCSDQMVATLSKDNCVGFLTVADEHSDAAFKDAVVSYICGHEAILQSEVWLNFCEKNLKLANEVYQRFVLLKSTVRQ